MPLARPGAHSSPAGGDKGPSGRVKGWAGWPSSSRPAPLTQEADMPDYWRDDQHDHSGSPAERRAAHVEYVTAAARPLDAAVRESYGEPWYDDAGPEVGCDPVIAQLRHWLATSPIVRGALARAERDGTAAVVRPAE